MKADAKKAAGKLKSSGWKVSAKKLSRAFKFKDFDDAFAFMTRCAKEIAKLDHHPEWFNVYNKVDVDLSTHDAGGVTMKDVQLAGIMNKIAAPYLKGGK